MVFAFPLPTPLSFWHLHCCSIHQLSIVVRAGLGYSNGDVQLGGCMSVFQMLMADLHDRAGCDVLCLEV